MCKAVRCSPGSRKLARPIPTQEAASGSGECDQGIGPGREATLQSPGPQSRQPAGPLFGRGAAEVEARRWGSTIVGTDARIVVLPTTPARGPCSTTACGRVVGDDVGQVLTCRGGPVSADDDGCEGLASVNDGGTVAGTNI